MILYMVVCLLNTTKCLEDHLPTIYIRCQVSPGFFGNEFYVLVGDSSAYVDRSNLRFTALPEDGRLVTAILRASIVKQEPEKALIEIPGQPVIGGLRTWVPKELFVAA
jgi:hypothetical protein